MVMKTLSYLLIRTPKLKLVAAIYFLLLVPIYAQDDPRLIDIDNLEKLDAIRRDLNGDGTPSGNSNAVSAYETAFGLSAGASVSCTGGCKGYELTMDLDFEDPNSYEAATRKNSWVDPSNGGNSGTSGWSQIGTSFSSSFSAVFEGNGYTISNIYIDRRPTDQLGLFGYLGSSARVRNVGIVGGTVIGKSDVGGLAGTNQGKISACYATAEVYGSIIGGLVGENNGTISTSYATGNATGTFTAGGLVGINFSGTILACYSTGNVIGTEVVGGLVGSSTNTSTARACYSTGNAILRNSVNIPGHGSLMSTIGQDAVGGLVGNLSSTSSITACYVTGNSTAGNASNVGGLVGKSGGGPITASYYNSDASSATQGIGNDADITDLGKTTADLQSSTDYTDIYLNWNVNVDDVSGVDDPWDFGTDSQYPALKADWNEDNDATAYEFGGQEREDPSGINLINVETIEQLDAIRYDLDGNGAPLGTSIERTTYETAFGLSPGETISCPSGCNGYELTMDLDFEDPNSYASATRNNSWINPNNGGTSGTSGWSPIGTDFTSSFSAVFEGRGYTISNLYINRPILDNVGLFGYSGTGTEIRNLGLEEGSVTGKDRVGCLVGENEGLIISCYTTGNASTTGIFSRLGALVGENIGTIISCYATGNTISTGDFSTTGGLIGRNIKGTIVSCYAIGNVTATGTAGGLVGENNIISPTQDISTISACYATGRVVGTSVVGISDVGGLVGYNNNVVRACYATGNVIANGRNSNAGGLVGDLGSKGSIKASYATSNVTANGDGSSARGLIAENDAGAAAIIEGSYFDYTASNRTDADARAKTTSEMQSPTDYGSGMDIYANWNIDVDEGLSIGTDDGKNPGDATSDDPWDFVGDKNYPKLKVDFDRDGRPSAAEFGAQNIFFTNPQ